MKTMPFWKTYLALTVLAGLSAYIYFVESKREGGKDAKPKEKVLAFEKAKVKELQLQSAGGETIRLVREGGSWRMVSPLSVPADSGGADSLVSSIETLEIDEVAMETPGDLKEFGLETPRTQVSLLQEGATEPLKLLLGDKTPDGSSVYAKLPTQPRVFTIPAHLQSSFDKKPFDLRDRDLLHVKRDAVKGIEVKGPEGDFTLSRGEKEEWAFTKPLPTSAGRWSVDGLLGTIENLRMDSVAAEAAKDLKVFGLHKPSRTVTLLLQDGGSKALEIGTAAEGEPTEGKDGKRGVSKGGKGTKEGRQEGDAKTEEGRKPAKYYARDGSNALVAVIPAALVDDLAKGMKELRAKRLLDVATYEVLGFDVETGGAKKVYARSSTKDKDGIDVYKWKRTSPDTADIDTNKVQDTLFLVGGIEVQEFLDSPGAPAAYGFDSPSLKVSLRYEGGKPASWFEVGEREGSCYARRPQDQAVLKLDGAKATELLRKFKEL